MMRVPLLSPPTSNSPEEKKVSSLLIVTGGKKGTVGFKPQTSQREKKVQLCTAHSAVMGLIEVGEKCSW